MLIYGIAYFLVSVLLFFLINKFILKKEKNTTQNIEEANPSNKEQDPNIAEMAIPSHQDSPLEKRRDAHLHVGRMITVLMTGAFVTILNQTLINVALPHMMNELNVSTTTIQWLVTGYMMVNGVLIPVTAFLIDRFGTRKLFIAAMSLFTIGGFICAIGTNFAIILTGRLIQATGTGIIMPLMMTVFLTVFPPEKRGTAMGTMGIAMIFAPAIGPTLSGWIVEHYTWRLLFSLIVPIGILDILLAFSWLTDFSRNEKVSLDFWGFLFSTLGFGGLLYGFSEAGSAGWGDSKVVISLIIGSFSLILFVWRELEVEKPMLDLRVFKYDVFSLTTAVSSIVNMAMMAAMVLLPVYLQNIRGFSPLESGLLLLPGALIMGVMSPIAGALFDRIGARPLALIGLTITAITTWWFTKLTADTSYGTLLLLYCLRMFGMSFVMMTIMTEGMNQLPLSLTSHGTAASNTMRQVAGSLGTALLVSVMSNRSNFHMAALANEMTSTHPIFYQQFVSLSHSLAASTGISSQAGMSLATNMLYGFAQKQSVIEGINDSFVVATLITVVALILSFFIKRTKRRKI